MCCTPSTAAGDDYQMLTRQLEFTSEVTSVNIPITLLDDNIVEGDESFAANIENMANTEDVMLNPATAVVTITDDDGECVRCEV